MEWRAITDAASCDGGQSGAQPLQTELIEASRRIGAEVLLRDLLQRYYENEHCQNVSTEPVPSPAESRERMQRSLTLRSEIASYDWSRINGIGIVNDFITEHNRADHYIGSTCIPDLVPILASAGRWVDFISRRVDAFRAISSFRRAFNGSEGMALGTIVGTITFAMGQNQNIGSPADRQRLMDVLYSVYRNFDLSTSDSMTTLSPQRLMPAGAYIQYAATLGDPRAFQRAVDMIYSFFENPSRVSSVNPFGEVSNFQSAIFAIGSYTVATDQNRARIRNGILNRLLVHPQVPTYIKDKVRDTIQGDELRTHSYPSSF